MATQSREIDSKKKREPPSIEAGTFADIMKFMVGARSAQEVTWLTHAVALLHSNRCVIESIRLRFENGSQSESNDLSYPSVYSGVSQAVLFVRQ